MLQAVRASASQLVPRQQDFAQQLHFHVTALIGDTGALAGTGGQTFCEQLVHALLWAALTGDPPHRITGGLRQLGAMNQLAGFPADRYVGVAHALIRAVRALSGYDWSASLGSAWITYFQWVRAQLLAGAQQAAAQQAAAQQAAAQQAAAQAAAAQQAALRREPGPAAPAQKPPAPAPLTADGEVNLESVAGLLDEEDDEGDDSYGQIMLSMTFDSRREPPKHRG